MICFSYTWCVSLCVKMVLCLSVCLFHLILFDWLVYNLILIFKFKSLTLLIVMVTDIHSCVHICVHIQVENTFVSSSLHEDILSILKSTINPVKVLAVPQTRRSTSHSHYRLVHIIHLSVCMLIYIFLSTFAC